MIWILALLCLGGAALVGYTQGPIRGVFVLVGLFVATLLAGPVGYLAKPLVQAAGYKHPIALYAIPPIIGFVVIWIVFHVVGTAVHKKIIVKHKYQDDDARYFRWERIFTRLGLCVGVLCGAVFFIILLLPVYVAGYFTTQFMPGDQGSTKIRMVNSLRNDMHTLKLDRVLAAYDPLPASVYEVSDLLATILGNRTLVTRVARYPVFVGLGERPEYHDLAVDPDFVRLYNTQAPPAELLKNPKLQAIVMNPTVCGELMETVTKDLEDLKIYLNTGKSPKYDDEKILGCWFANPQGTFLQERKKVSNSTASQLFRLKIGIGPQVSGLNLTMTTDRQAILRRGEAIATATVLARGTWTKNGTNYQITLPGSKPETMDAALQEDQLTFTKDNLTIVFDREL